MSKTVSVRLSNETHQKLLDACNKKGTTMNYKLKEMIDDEMNSANEDDSIELSELEKLVEQKNHFSEIEDAIRKTNSLHDEIRGIKTEIEQLVSINNLKTPCRLRCVTQI